MSKTEGHHGGPSDDDDDELTDRVYERVEKEGPGRRRSCGAFCPLGRSAPLLSRTARKAEKYKTTLLRIGTCHSINLSAADGAAGCEAAARPPLSLSLPPLSPPRLTSRFLPFFPRRGTPAYARTRTLSRLSVTYFLSFLCVRRHGPGGPASPTECAHTCSP